MSCIRAQKQYRFLMSNEEEENKYCFFCLEQTREQLLKSYY